MTDIVLRWAGSADAAVGSTYKVERSLDNAAWTTLAASQAATTPYASPSSALAGDTAWGATSVVLESGTPFSSSGHGFIDDAHIQWTAKSTNTLTGVTWHTGAGTYASGTAVVEAHESYSDSGVTITLNAVLYRVTHTDAAGNPSAPAYIWYFSPPAPVSSAHCVVIVAVATDLGVEARSALSIQCYLSADTSFSDRDGLHLDAQQSANKTLSTNAFGLAFFQCWKNSKRSPVTGSDAAYIFLLDSDVSTRLTVSVATIPDRDWVLLNQIASSTS